MKLRKTKLTAILMSALMVASTMSPTVYAAEDVIIDEAVAVEAVEEGGEELAAEAPVEVEVEAVDVEEQADESAELQSAENGAYKVNPSTISFAYTVEKPSMAVSYTMYWVDATGVTDPNNYKVVETTATIKKATQATCTENGVTVLTVEIQGEQYDSKEFITATATGHKLPDDPEEVVPVTAATHFADGVGTPYYRCTVCNQLVAGKNIVLPKQEHNWKDELKYVAGYNTKLDANGQPVLVDKNKDGYYEVYRVCADDKYEEYVTTKVIYAKEVKYARITDQEDIVTNVLTADNEYIPVNNLKVDHDSLELVDCSKPGYYTVTYYTADKAKLGEEVVTVDPHHVEVTAVEFKNAKDAAQCTVTYDEKTKTYKVVNNSCAVEVEYYEVTHCTAAGCKEAKCTTSTALVVDKESGKSHADLHFVRKVAKTAVVSDQHVISTETRQQVKNNTLYNGKILLNVLEVIVENDKYVQLADVPDDICTVDGTVTVEYLCHVCGKVIYRDSVNVKATGHVAAPVKIENKVLPTCHSKGSYDMITYCERCGKVIEEKSDRNIEIPRLKHTNETVVGKDDTTDSLNAADIRIRFVGDKVVDYDGELLTATGRKTYGAISASGAIGTSKLGKYQSDLSVKIEVYSICENDGCSREVVLDSATIVGNGKLTVKVVDIQKQDSKGRNGYITLQATYSYKLNGKTITFTSATDSFAYYSTLAAYQGRVEDEVVANGLHLGDDGKYYYYLGGEVATDVTRIVTYDGEQFLVVNGVCDNTVNGFWHNEKSLGGDDQWYFLANNMVQRGYSDVLPYDGAYFYIKNGRLDTSVTGLVSYDGGKFLFGEGRKLTDVSGLWHNEKSLGGDDKWYFLSEGEVQLQHTGVTTYDGASFYVKNGVLAEDFNGTVVAQDGYEYNVVAGMLKDKVA